jgi:inhibitor of KinA
MTTYQLLGDQAILASFADEVAAWQLAGAVRGANPGWLIDLVQAYTTVAVFFDVMATHPAEIIDRLRDLDRVPQVHQNGRLLQVPCCYLLGPDLERVAHQRGLTSEEVMNLHAGTEYTVCAIGFCPGFPYLGYLPEPLCGVPRLPAPRLRVEAGSVGMTGRQTGIYTEVRPGGWNLVGRTPLTLVDVVGGYFPLRTGDKVRFVPIGEAEYHRLQGQRLSG